MALACTRRSSMTKALSWRKMARPAFTVQTSSNVSPHALAVTAGACSPPPMPKPTSAPRFGRGVHGAPGLPGGEGERADLLPGGGRRAGAGRVADRPHLVRRVRDLGGAMDDRHRPQ